jgi:Flp pilus assembly protein TadG
MKRLARLRRSERGATLIEFALILPALLTFIVGITQLGTLFFVNSDLRAAVGEGARLASLYPVPSDSTITTGVSSKFVHLTGSNLTAPSVSHGTDTSGNPYVEITAAYRVPLNFIFFTVSPVTITETRRVFTQVASPYSADSTSSGAGTSTTSTSSGTTSTSSGTTSTTSATSSGTTTSASSTSASSTSASSTSASSTSASSTSSGTTSSTTTTSTGNNSNGNSNGNSDPHGKCKTNC